MTRIIPLSHFDDASESVAGATGGVVSIGNFDGVHLGHASLLAQVRREAERIGGPAVAVVFDPHPAAILRPEKAPPKLTSIQRRAELMSQHGIDALVVCETTREFLNLSAEEFFESLIRKTLSAAAMIEGPNFFFGRDRGGDIKLLAELCDRSGIGLQIVEASENGDQMISSTRIRQCLAVGDVATAAEMLGGAYQIGGVVRTGAKRGRTIGFPTANLTEIEVIVPSLGVYAGVATVDGQRIGAAVHIGPNPTFESDQNTKVEVHLLDFDGNLYGKFLLVDFVARVRDIARFDSADELVAQLERDIATTRSIIKPNLLRHK